MSVCVGVDSIKRCLFFHSIFVIFSINTEEVFSDFRRVPSSITYAQGVEILKTEEVKLAQNHPAGTAKAENSSH